MSHLKTIRDAYLKAADAPAAEREEILASLDPAIRSEVAALLEMREPARDFLASGRDDSATVMGESIGAYKVMEKGGEGGMGVVYRACRTDGEFRRDVAIKFIDARMFAPEAERRFLAERRILALLDHPNIVRLLDGGTWRGRRYLVLEWVNGKAVNDYWRDAGLSLADKLRLFRTICGAVQFAHLHLVLHRDIKASNILVTNEGQVKVLDFGIARLVAGEGGATAQTTMLHPMSLSCASPEQVRGERLTLASDIYALGLLLHELLTGVNPQANGTATEIRRRIENGPLPAPSQTDPSIPSDLDAIMLKASAPEPERRYGSAAELADDIGRFLNSSPVSARNPSWVYLVSRFVRRNRALSFAFAALALAILSGTGASLWQLRRAEQQKAVAERRFSEARRLVSMVIHEIQPQMAEINGTLPLRVQIIERTLAYLEALRGEAGDNPSLIRELIDGYVQLAAVSGDVGQANIGDRNRAADLLAKASTLADQLAAQSRALDPSIARSISALYRAQARQYASSGDLDHAVQAARRAVAISDLASRADAANAAVTLADVVSGAESIGLYQKAIDIWSGELAAANAQQAAGLNQRIAISYRNLSTALDGQHEYEKAIRAGEQALRIDEANAKLHPSSPVDRLAVAFDLGTIGTASESLGRFADAAENWRRSVELREKVLAANPQDRRAADRVAFALTEQGKAESRMGKRADAEAHLRRAVNLYAWLSKTSGLNLQSMRQYSAASYLLGLAASDAAQRCEWFRQADRIASDYESLKNSTADQRFSEMISQAHAGARACGSR